MPRDGALTLSDVRDPALSIVCEPCGRRETYDVARLMERHGDAKLTDLLQTLADCPKARSVSIHDRCRAVFERLSLWPSALAKLLPESELADAQAQMTPEQYAQEYLCSFDAAILGAYYGKLMPTPTQAESERMADGELVMLKRWDLSPIDPQSFDASEPPGRPGTAPVNEAAPVAERLSASWRHGGLHQRRVDRPSHLHAGVASGRGCDRRRDGPDLQLGHRRRRGDDHRRRDGGQ
jgi:hypothetical protein